MPVESLVPPLVHTAEERFATHAYFQSLMTVRFVLERSGAYGLRLLTEKLASGEVHPGDAFWSGAAFSDWKTCDAAWREWVRLWH